MIERHYRSVYKNYDGLRIIIIIIENRYRMAHEIDDDAATDDNTA